MKERPYELELWKIILLCFVVGAGAMTVSYFLPKNNACTPSQDTQQLSLQLEQVQHSIEMQISELPLYVNCNK